MIAATAPISPPTYETSPIATAPAVEIDCVALGTTLEELGTVALTVSLALALTLALALAVSVVNGAWG